MNEYQKKLSFVITSAKNFLKEIYSEEPMMELIFEEHFFFELYYLYPNVSSDTFASKTNIHQKKIVQFSMEKYGLDFFQLCNKYRIEHFLSKQSIVFSEDKLNNFSLRGTGFTNIDEFKNAFSIYAAISLN